MCTETFPVIFMWIGVVWAVCITFLLILIALGILKVDTTITKE